MPYFSVVLPTYNRSGEIRSTIESVLDQNYKDWELVIISDGCTDDTERIVEGYCDPRIRLISLPENQGHPGRPRNLGLAHSEGEIVTYLDHDDRYEPDHLELLRRLFEDRGVRVVSTGCEYYDDSGARTGQSTFLETVWHREFQVLGALYQPTRVSHRREVLFEHGEWTEESVGLEDWELWLRLADGGERLFTTASRTVSIYRGSQTRSYKVPMKYGVPLAEIDCASRARETLDSMVDSDFMGRLREVHLEEAGRWYETLYSEGGMSLPGGYDLDHVLDAIPEEVPHETLGPLMVKESNGKALVIRPLMCVSQTHADRINSLLAKRFPEKLGLIREAFEDHIPKASLQ